jgi:hypothetical protein
VRVVLDDDEVSFDEDAPLQKRLWLSSSAGGSSGFAPAVPEVATTMNATVDREAVDRRAAEEVAAKVAADKEATDKRATVKVAADKEATDKRVTEEAAVKEASVGAAGNVSPPGQALSSAADAKRVAEPSGSTLRLNDPTGAFENLDLSNFLYSVYFF